MKTLNATDEQWDTLIDVVLEERWEIRAFLNEAYDPDERLDMVERYNHLGQMFDMEEWSE